MCKIALSVTGAALIAGTAVLWAGSIRTGTPMTVASISIHELHHSKALSDLPVQTLEDLI